jgi:hypothetical protein
VSTVWCKSSESTFGNLGGEVLEPAKVGVIEYKHPLAAVIVYMSDKCLTADEATT